ncbi:UDP-glucose--hexose-1-phosphate uridylyltransferase [Lacticaseibacillus yichunensis]|uniref:Galactose-1-phosphate uridylyltransferase n=2 Tax=Bacilli TaxID=91061 RepID=A0ABW4CS53_9LACO|nr:UDP-glucose--hexose-1-phosphate uridylyltransferase [Lacticaseibacillus yichunensis]
MNAVERQVAWILDQNSDFSPLDTIFLTNRLLADCGDEALALPAKDDALANLDQLVEAGVQAGKTPDSLVGRQILEAELMSWAAPKPSTVNRLFWEKYAESPRRATDWFFQLSQADNYIQTRAIAKNIAFPAHTDYGDLEITINLSKPEKDPKDIAAAAKVKASGYPACALCLENEGYLGRLDAAARGNHRVVRLAVGGRTWGFQYSPYAYFNEHAIFLDSLHEPMRISQQTFANLLDLVTLLPDYFVGSNADLPIVGGSMLAHEHYQGGRHTFAMAKAPVEKPVALGIDNVSCGIVKWPMSVLRLTSDDKMALTAAAEQIRKAWASYSDETVDVRATTNGVPHHTVTPIARRSGTAYQLDLVLRDNQTSSTFPDGIFHPHADVQHIKKENIGLIEVMGLAVLPARLQTELAEVEKYLLGRPNEMREAHKPWAEQLKLAGDWTAANCHERVLQAVGQVFSRVLEDAGVFKRDVAGQAAFARFCATLQ